MDISLFRKQQVDLYPQRMKDVVARPDHTTTITHALLSAICVGDQHKQKVLARALYPKAPNVYPMEIAPLVLLEDWCKSHNAPHRVVHQAQHITVYPTSPHTAKYDYDTQPSEYAQIPDGTIIPGWDQVLTSDGRVIGDTSYNFNARKLAMKVTETAAELVLPEPEAVLFYYGEREERIEADVFFLSVPFLTVWGAYHVGHWMIDFLPRLLAFELFEESRSWKIAVPEDIDTKQLESLSMMGFDEDRILKLRRNTRYVCARLHVFKIGRSMPPNPIFVHFLRDKLYVAQMPPRCGKRIYLERGEPETRLIANAGEFEAVLDKYEFVRVDVGKLTMAEQQELLADAEVLMGSFGSALLSVYFAPSDSVLIDIIGEHRHDPTLPHTCFFIGVSHQFLVCKTAPPTKWWHAKDPDILVDCAELERRLSAIAQ